MKVPAQRGTGNQRGTESVLQMILILAAINCLMLVLYFTPVLCLPKEVVVLITIRSDQSSEISQLAGDNEDGLGS